MVTKISVGSSLYGALFYNYEKVAAQQAKVLSTNLIRHPYDGKYNHINDWQQDFESFLPSHFRTKKPVIHISLNPHPNDKLTDQQLGEIAEKYMERLGYGNQPYIVFKHSDIEREHIYIVSLRVDRQGKKINDQFEYKRNRAISCQLEREYNLLPNNTPNNKAVINLSPVDISKGDLKKQVGNIIKAVHTNYSFQTFGEYRTLLSLYGITVQEVKGERNGKPYNGLIYSVIDKEGKPVSLPFKSSLFGKRYGAEGLNRKYTYSADKIKKTKARGQTRSVLSTAFSQPRTEKEFYRYLKENHIDTVFRRNDTGRITGATFINHATGTVLNGSRLGKEFSANFFNDLYGTGSTTHRQSPANKPSIHSENNPSDTTLGQLLSVAPDTYHPEDNPYPSLPKKKKRKRRMWGRQE